MWGHLAHHNQIQGVMGYVWVSPLLLSQIEQEVVLLSQK